MESSKEKRIVISQILFHCTRACLKNHSSNLHASIYGIFCLHSVDVARYAALIQAKSPANCDAHLAESLFQTHSKHSILPRKTGTWEKRVPSSYDQNSICLYSVDVARYAALIQAKSPTNCNVHLTESIFQTRSSSQDYISCQAFSIPYILSRI